MIPLAFPALFVVLPIFAGLAGLFGFAGASAPASRHYALGASLAIALAVALLTFLTGFGGPEYLFGALLRAGLAIMLAQIIAASLLDRARSLGLIIGSVLGSFAILTLLIDELPMLLPVLPRTAWLLACLIAACMVGLIGSALLPAHPARAMRGGQLRAPLFTYARDLGLVLFAVALVLWAWGNEEGALAPSFCISAITASLFPLLRSRNAYGLHRAAEGALAGSIIALMLPVGGWVAVIYGIAAAIFVERGEHIAGALRLDDPARLMGMVLLPAMAGLALPFANDLALLADALRWFGATILVGGVVSLGWFAIMATVGFAAPPARVREGLDFL